MTQICKSFNSEQSSRLRQRNDFVGKRVLCLTKSFDIPTPSPAQLSSSLWMSDTIDALRDVAVSRTRGTREFRFPAWCPKHHHHHSQDDDQNFLDLINQTLQNGARGLNFTDSLPEHHDQASSSNKRSRSRLSVRKTSLLKPMRGPQSSNKRDDIAGSFERKDFSEGFSAYNCKSCEEQTRKECQDPRNLIKDLPWRLGTIRAASSRDVSDKSFSLMIEFDHFDLQQRDWYQIWGTSSDETINQTTTSYCSASDKSMCDQNDILNTSEQNVSESKSVSVNYQHPSGISASGTNQSHSGFFHAILIESSICCLLRSKTPVGDERIWPALLFEPLIDEYGFFEVVGDELRAVEYLDPVDEKLVDQSDCDIAPIIASLKSEYADFCRMQSSPEVSSIQSSSQVINDLELELSKQKSTTLMDQNLKLETLDCLCWSPRVEFVPKYKLFSINNDQPREEGSQSAADNSSQGEKLVNDSSSIALSSSKLNTFNKYLQLFFKSRSLLIKQNNNHPMPLDPFLANDLTQAILRYPSMYKKLRDWHLFQDAQFLLGNDSTAPLLVGNRVKVYRCSGATHWYTAVILSYDERDHLLTLIDDTVLERHQEDPTLLEMHFLDEKLVQAFIVGDAAVKGRRNSQSWRPRPQRAAKNPRLPNSTQLPPDFRNGINKVKSKQSSSKPPNSSTRTIRSPLPDGLMEQQMTSTSRNVSNKAAKLTLSDGEGNSRTKSRNVKLASGDNNLVDDMFLMPRLSAFKALKSRCMEQQKIDYPSSMDFLTSDSLPSIKTAAKQKSYVCTKPNVTLEGRNFLSHRLRLEAIDRYVEASECSNNMVISTPSAESDYRPLLTKTDLKPMDNNTSTGGVRSDDSSTSLQASRFLSSTDSSSRTSMSLNVQLRFLDDAIAKQDEET